jgi:hypothetical protein
MGVIGKNTNGGDRLHMLYVIYEIVAIIKSVNSSKSECKGIIRSDV